MSHVSTVEILVKDLDALEAACDLESGLELRRGQKTFRMYGSDSGGPRWMNDYSQADAAYRHGVSPEDYGKCDHAVSVRGSTNAYEVGLVKVEGGYRLVWDHWDGGYGLCDKIAADADQRDAGLLLQRYGVAAVKRAAARTRGHAVTRETKLPDGSVKLVVRTG